MSGLISAKIVYLDDTEQVVLYDPSNLVTLNELISDADNLMYEHKKRNRGEK